MNMKEELTSKGNSIVMPFLVGGVVGAGIVLLLAPKAGREILDDMRRLTTRTKDRVTSTIDRGKLLYEEGKSAVTSAIDAGKTAFLQEKEKFRHVS